VSGDGDFGDEDGDSVLVAEFVLGLLEPAEHARVAALIAANPILQRELRFWEMRLQPLDDEFAEAAPPPGLLATIETRLFGTEPSQGSLARLWNNLVLWRALTAAAIIVAAVGLGVGLLRPVPTSSELANELVASLDAQGSDVKLIAIYDGASATVRLIGLSGGPVPGKDYELWYIHGQSPPVSMGVIPVDARTSIAIGPQAQAAIDPGTVLAVTVEPKGGSPTGAPTGPIVAKGAAIRL
jgi:anti-sigma-K factor RskA